MFILAIRFLLGCITHAAKAAPGEGIGCQKVGLTRPCLRALGRSGRKCLLLNSSWSFLLVLRNPRKIECEDEGDNDDEIVPVVSGQLFLSAGLIGTGSITPGTGRVVEELASLWPSFFAILHAWVNAVRRVNAPCNFCFNTI